MNDVLLANLFFIITGSAVLVVAGFLCVVCYHAIKLVRAAKKTLDRLENGTDAFLEDVRTLRDRIVSGQIFGKILTAIVHAMAKGRQPRSPSRKRKEIDESE
jgi:hypothetical protein